MRRGSWSSSTRGGCLHQGGQNPTKNLFEYKRHKFFLRPSPKAGRELQTVSNTGRRRMMQGGPLAKNQPEPVTGP